MTTIALGQQGQRDPHQTRELTTFGGNTQIHVKGFIPPVMSMHRPEDEVKMENGVRYVTLIGGTGTDIIDGCYIGFELNAFTTKGELLHASREPGNKPAGVRVPGGEMFPAWEKALMGAKRGEIRKILIPKELGPGPDGLGPLPGDTDLVLECGVFAVAPPLDPIVSQLEKDGSRWMDLRLGEGEPFDRNGFANCHINVFNDEGELMGSTTIARYPIQVSGDADRYWVRFAHGMKSGGTRVIEFDEPDAYRKMRLQQAGLNAPEGNKPRRWRMIVDCISVTAPILQTPHDPSKERNIGDGIKIVDLVIGEGDTFPPPQVPGEPPQEWTPTINYSSWNADDGSLYDSSYKPGGQPIPYSKGLYPSVWERALKGMRKGGKRKMIVPANIDKGQDFRQIPDDRGFIYELELVDWEPALFTLTPGAGGGFDLSDEPIEFDGNAADR